MKSCIAGMAALKQRFVLMVLLCSFAGMAWAAADQKVAKVSITPGRVTWKTTAEAQGWTLTVSGQGIYLRERYDDAETPSLGPIAPDGQQLLDGDYNWELRAINPVQQAENLIARRTPARQRRMRTARGTFERRVLRRSIVVSGSFRIENGAFVMPRLREESEESR